MAWGMGHGAWGPGETPAYDREPFGLFHGAGMEHGAWSIGHGAWSILTYSDTYKVGIKMENRGWILKE